MLVAQGVEAGAQAEQHRQVMPRGPVCRMALGRPVRARVDHEPPPPLRRRPDIAVPAQEVA
jgi:hypothetical protein